MPDAAGKNRIALMSFTLSWAIVVNLLYGAIIEDTVTLPFFSLTLLYVLSCGLILQFIFGNVNRNVGRIFCFFFQIFVTISIWFHF